MSENSNMYVVIQTLLSHWPGSDCGSSIPDRVNLSMFFKLSSYPSENMVPKTARSVEILCGCSEKANKKYLI